MNVIGPGISAHGRTGNGVVIVGGGLAGLFCALKLSPLPVTILTAARLGEGASSAWAQGGIAAAIAPGDTVESHVADTVAAGAGLVDEEVARLMAGKAVDSISDLLGFGVPFDRDIDGRLRFSREAAHSESRIVRVGGDGAGRAIMQALICAVRGEPSIRLMEGFAGEEIVMRGGRAAAVAVRDLHGGNERFVLEAAAIVLATGGIGHLYGVTTNPHEACGEGIGMAARAGATMADCEFVQFHPTAIDAGVDPAPLATEALRGRGATLVNSTGRRFMSAIDPAGELAARDIVARAIFEEIDKGRGAFLDCTTAIGGKFADEFPVVHEYCRMAGIDPAVQKIPVCPAAHYFMGGVATDTFARTSLPGLWACGEVASTGVHGANRLASNSLLEAVVFSARAASAIAAEARFSHGGQTSKLQRGTSPCDPSGDLEVMAKLRRIMSSHFGVVRHRDGMTEGLSAILELEHSGRDIRLANMLSAARLVAVAALMREESRGSHFRSDFPCERDNWRMRRFLTLEQADEYTRCIEGLVE